MRRGRAALSCSALALVASVLLAGQEQLRPQFRASTDVVTIDVSVSRRNAPVAGLTTPDFDLTDNGVPQTATVVTMDAVPVDVTLVVDQTSFTQRQVGSRLAADLSRTAARLRPADRLRVITFATDVRELLPMQHWTRGPADPAPDALEQLLKAKWPQALDRFERQPDGRRWSLYDALLLAMARPAALGRRHLIVGISMGVDSGSVLNDARLFRAVAARTDALLHVTLGRDRMEVNQPRRVTLGGGPVGGRVLEPLHGRYARLVITAAAEATGGQVQEFDPIGAFRKILDSVRQSYVLQYTLTGVEATGWHDVVVRTPRFPNYTVRARGGISGAITTRSARSAPGDSRTHFAQGITVPRS